MRINNNFDIFRNSLDGFWINLFTSMRDLGQLELKNMTAIVISGNLKYDIGYVFRRYYVSFHTIVISLHIEFHTFYDITAIEKIFYLMSIHKNVSR